MKIAVASDHAGYSAKQEIVAYLNEKGYTAIDLGTYSLDSCDYPDYALKCANEVVSGRADFGILICGTGIGMAICANKVKGIRCANCSDEFSTRMTREHNDANMLALGARVISVEKMKQLVDIFLSTPFSNEEKHIKRIAKITKAENSQL